MRHPQAFVQFIGRPVTALALTASAVIALAAWLPQTSAAAVPSVVTAQLDGDSALERVERVETAASQAETSGCSHLRIVDGDRTQRLTATSTSASSYCLIVQKLSVHDLTGDSRAEVVWETNISGGRAISIGAHSWDGRSARRIFSANPGKIGRKGRFSFLPQVFVLPPRRGLRELKVRDGVHEADDALCCPTFRRTRRFRWNGRMMALVAGSTNYVRLHP